MIRASSSLAAINNDLTQVGLPDLGESVRQSAARSQWGRWVMAAPACRAMGELAPGVCFYFQVMVSDGGSAPLQ